MVAPSYKTPADLAKAVQKLLEIAPPLDRTVSSNERVDGASLPVAALIDLFSTLFVASFRTEEGQPIKLVVVYIAPDQPENTTELGWQLVRFDTQIPLDERALVKLALASDPKTSAIAVYHTPEDEVIAWGLVDQRDLVHLTMQRRFKVRANKGCGYFEASIEVIGVKLNCVATTIRIAFFQSCFSCFLEAAFFLDAAVALKLSPFNSRIVA